MFNVVLFALCKVSFLFSKGRTNLPKKKVTKVGRGATVALNVYKEYEESEERKNRIEKRRRRGTDRLKNDKKYLNSLSKKLTQRTDIPTDNVHDEILEEADNVLTFLKQRDLFWDQLQHK